MRRSSRPVTSLFALVVGLSNLALPQPVQALDPGPWDEVLRAHAHRGGMDYAALAADTEARAKLDRFLADASAMPESADLASWLNVYNAIVVRDVLEMYPTRSVRDDARFFQRARHSVAGRARSLDHIENEIVRPRFRDARVHAALNCGARSCPPLHGRAFRAGNLDATLDRLARRFASSRQHVRVVNGGLQISQLFEWFAADFSRDAGSVLGWIRRYGDAEALADVPDDATLTYRRYDWRLNDSAR